MRTNKDNPNTANKLAAKMGLNIQELSKVTGIKVSTLTAANVGRAGESIVNAIEFISEIWELVHESKRNIFIKYIKNLKRN